MIDTVHATALVANATGILIIGPSGSGKSELALDMIDQCLLRGKPAALISDDRVILTVEAGVVIAAAPAALAGMIEVRGSGIHRIHHQAKGRIDLAVRLVGKEMAVRTPEKTAEEVFPGIRLPCLALCRESFSAARALLAHLGIYGGVKGLVS